MGTVNDIPHKDNLLALALHGIERTAWCMARMDRRSDAGEDLSRAFIAHLRKAFEIPRIGSADWRSRPSQSVSGHP